MTTWRAPVLVEKPRTVVITPRQADVLDLICAGRTNVQISRRLQVSEGTVKTHVARLLERMHAHDRAHAAFLAGSQQVTPIIDERWRNP